MRGAREGTGTAGLAQTIADYESYMAKHNLVLKKRARHWHDRLLEMLRDELLRRVVREQLSEKEISRYAAEVAEHKRDPYSLVEEIVASLGKNDVRH